MEFSPVWWVGKKPEPVKNFVEAAKAFGFHYCRVVMGPQFGMAGRSA